MLRGRHILKLVLKLNKTLLIIHFVSFTRDKMNWKSIFILFHIPRERLGDITRAPRGTDRSPWYNEHSCYKLDFLANQKGLSMTAKFVKSVRKANNRPEALYQAQHRTIISNLDMSFF